MLRLPKLKIEYGHVLFYTGADPLSNFFYYDRGLTVEHGYQRRKALFAGDTERADRILACTHPAQTKKIGFELKLDRAGWNAKREHAMWNELRVKFLGYPVFTDYLLETGDAVLVEASDIDGFWGAKASKDQIRRLLALDPNDTPCWPGQNRLGTMLEQLREQIRNGTAKPLR